MSNQPDQAEQNRRSLTGYVTKLVGDEATYGFINDEIFFQQLLVSDGPALVGDQVFAECEFSAHLPIKWNATSVKILQKANNSSGHQQQQQQQFLPNANVANTYQQHRLLQDRQSSGRLLDQANNQDNNNLYNNQQQQQQQHQPPTRLLPPPQTESQPAIPAMGPASLAYTSQLGSAFIQNPAFAAPPPFLAQQQQQLPMLPQQNSMLPQNQAGNQRGQNQGSNPNRRGFQNQGHDNNSKMNERSNQNRNDRRRSRDRDNSQNRNNRNSKFRDNSSRDRQSGGSNSNNNNNHNNRRSNDRHSARASPPAHMSTSRDTSVSSEKGVSKLSKKHYEVQNIPKTRIMNNVNAHNIKQRCSSALHVPSDLKEIFVNKHFRLDLKNIPKPIKFNIEQSNPEPAIKTDVPLVGEKQQTESDNAVSLPDGDTKTIEETSSSQTAAVSAATSTTGSCTSETSRSVDVLPTPPSSKSDVRLNHKYGVKVLLISLHDLEALYKNAFGPNLDCFNSEAKLNSRTDDMISLLCSKSANGGHSLIGGKFDPILDGFLEGETNEFERNGRQPDLIATCKRVVLDQTGLDLGSCQTWIKFSTFIYNNKSDYFSPKASIEYSFIYIPALWTLLTSESVAEPSHKVSINDQTRDVPTQMEIGDKSEAVDKSEFVEKETKDESVLKLEATTDENSEEVLQSTTNALESDSDSVPVKLTDLKVTDLKAKLDQIGLKYKTTAKKSDLIGLLQEHLSSSTSQIGIESQLDVESDQQSKQESSSAIEPKDQPESADQADEGTKHVPFEDESSQKDPEKQLEDGELESAGSDESVPPVECDITEATGRKRKLETSDVGDSKKVCLSDAKAELIKRAFTVYSREQFQLSLVSLHEATTPSKHDQFELSVASNLLKESLIQHFSEYMITTLVEDLRQRKSLASASSSGAAISANSNGSSSANSNLQEPNPSDRNNNSSAVGKANTSPYKSPTSGLKQTYPIGRYINLAFAYFDTSLMGYLNFDDLARLFNNTGLTISKRALTSLLLDTDGSSSSSSNEKFNYLSLSDLSPGKYPPTYVYEFPEQFTRLPGSKGGATALGEIGSLESCSVSGVIEFKGVTYDLNKLVQQVKDAEAERVSLFDRFNYAIENSDKQMEEIHVLEVSQKSLSKAIKAQNDEICELKRERESLKKKLDALRKGIKGTITSLSDLTKAATLSDDK